MHLSVVYPPSITGPAVLAGIAAPLVAASRALGCSKVCGLYAARAALVRNVSLYFVFIARNRCMTLRFSMALLSIWKADNFWAAAVARGARWIPPAAKHEAAATRRQSAHRQQFLPTGPAGGGGHARAAGGGGGNRRPAGWRVLRGADHNAVPHALLRQPAAAKLAGAGAVLLGVCGLAGAPPAAPGGGPADADGGAAALPTQMP